MNAHQGGGGEQVKAAFASGRHSLGSGGLDAATMMDLFSGSGEGQPAADTGYTIDVASFEECFGAAGTRGGDSAEDDEEGEALGDSGRVGKGKRRETADPSKLRELLMSCSTNSSVDDKGAESSERKLEPPVGRRRVSLDPKLLSSRGEEANNPSRSNRRATLAIVPEEETEDETTTSASTTRGRPSITWSFDETRQNMEELRRQLQVERDVATDAEKERDELAEELVAVQRETVARIELIASLEAQRDAAVLRATAADAKAHQASEAEAAAQADAEECRAQANQAKKQVVDLVEENRRLQDRVQALNQVKITKEFAARVRALKDERDVLKDRLQDKENMHHNSSLAAPNQQHPSSTLMPSTGDDCRQS